MRTYTVHHTSPDPATIVTQADRVIFVAEGFSFTALVFQIFWLIWHRLWIASAVYLAVFTSLVVLAQLTGIAFISAAIVPAGMVLFAFEALDIRRYFLALGGRPAIGLVAGRRFIDAEYAYFENLSRQAAQTARHQTQAPAPPATVASTANMLAAPADDGEDVIGMFPKPDG
jgi:hypothetical protein